MGVGKKLNEIDDERKKVMTSENYIREGFCVVSVFPSNWRQKKLLCLLPIVTRRVRFEAKWMRWIFY